MITSGRAKPVNAGTARVLLARVARAQVDGRTPSLSVGVVRDGELVWTAGRGAVNGAEPDAGTQYRIGSITKGFTAVQVMRLRDEGLLDIEDRLDQHVDGTGFGDRTIRDLLSHTAGLPAEPPGQWWERSPGRPWSELAATFTAEELVGPRGSFHYSNPGFAALGRVVEMHRGRPWYDALRDEVLLPLGMTRTTYDAEAPFAPGMAVHPFADVTMTEVVQDLGGMSPAGQLWSTVSDLARWAAFIGGDTGGVLSAETVAEMRRTKVVADDPAWQSGYGLGFQVLRLGSRELIGHGGSVPGFLAFLAVDVERQVACVELANVTSGLQLVTPDLLELLEANEPHVPAAWQPAGEAPADLEITGIWHWGPAPYLLRLRGNDTLELSPAGSAGRTSLFARKASAWVGTSGYWRDEPLRIIKRADGTVSHLDIATYVFTRTPYDPSAPIPGGVGEHPWQASPGA